MYIEATTCSVPRMPLQFRLALKSFAHYNRGKTFVKLVQFVARQATPLNHRKATTLLSA